MLAHNLGFLYESLWTLACFVCSGKQSRSGGVSQPMDFVPTFQSSWNCQDMLANVEFDDSVWTTASDLSAIAPISGPGGTRCLLEHLFVIAHWDLHHRVNNALSKYKVY